MLTRLTSSSSRLHMRETLSLLSRHKSSSEMLTPREIYDKLQEHVVGQHNVKVALSVGVHNHLMRSKVLGYTKPNSSSVESSTNPNVQEVRISYAVLLNVGMSGSPTAVPMTAPQ
mgnify:CR=1 FL=1